MSTVKSFAVGNGDMFYIAHNSDNFTIIDCCLSDENQEQIISDLRRASRDKGITRFISTHPDDDHFRGIATLDNEMPIRNFYCVKNDTEKEEETEHFLHYCSLRDDHTKVFHLQRGCQRKWLNMSDNDRGSSGIRAIWPDITNADFKEALQTAEDGGSPNNISAVLTYGVTDGPSFMWLGDFETDFMEKIAEQIEWPRANIVFGAHHGRASGRIPHSILDQLKPNIIVLGEAPSRHLHYYGGYNTLTQNTAGDLTFDIDDDRVHIFASEPDYEADFLTNENGSGDDFYLGSLLV